MNAFANWRALLPSWKFFDEIGPGFDLEYRFRDSGSISGSNSSSGLNSESDFTPWCNARPPVHPLPWNLFFNPNQNLVHALDSLLQRLVIESQALDSRAAAELENSVTYGLAANWARLCVSQRLNQQLGQRKGKRERQSESKSGDASDRAAIRAAQNSRNELDGKSFQFRIVTRSTPFNASEEILLSLVHPV